MAFRARSVPPLIDDHKTAIANDVTCEDRGKPPFNGRLIWHVCRLATAAAHARGISVEGPDRSARLCHKWIFSHSACDPRSRDSDDAASLWAYRARPPPFPYVAI
jgi:hypothetical protein